MSWLRRLQWPSLPTLKLKFAPVNAVWAFDRAIGTMKGDGGEIICPGGPAVGRGLCARACQTENGSFARAAVVKVQGPRNLPGRGSIARAKLR